MVVIARCFGLTEVLLLLFLLLVHDLGDLGGIVVPNIPHYYWRHLSRRAQKRYDAEGSTD